MTIVGLINHLGHGHQPRPGPFLVLGALLLALSGFDGSFPVRDIILFIVFWPIGFLGGVGFTGVAPTCIIDAMRKNRSS